MCGLEESRVQGLQGRRMLRLEGGKVGVGIGRKKGGYRIWKEEIWVWGLEEQKEGVGIKSKEGGYEDKMKERRLW